MTLLEVRDVKKVYARKKKNGEGEIVALDNITFNLFEGEILGLIGPNGAGKSTLIKCITGLATQTAGTIKICGYDTVKEHVMSIRKVGAIIEQPDMYKDSTAMENLMYLGSISYFDEKKTKEQLKERAEKLLQLVRLYDRRNDKVSKFSLGMKQRLGIAQAVLSEPKLLILDEPTNGLDPEGIKEIRDIIIHLAHELNIGVLISSHNLSELQMTCDRFLIIQKGKLAAAVSAEELSSGGNVIVIHVDDVIKAKEVLSSEFELQATQTGDGRLEVKTDMPSGDIAKTLILNGITVNGISAKELSLEDYFLSLTHVGGAVKSKTSIEEDKDVR